jgi:type IV secretion system protein VirB3
MNSPEDLSAPLHESLNRPMLILGGERNAVLLLMVIAGVFIFSLHALWATAVGSALWIVGQFALARAGSYDPQLSRTGARSLRYQRYYPAAASPFAPHRKVR